MVDWKHLAKSLIIGAVFAFIVYVISGSDSSFGFGLFLAYLEYRNLFENISKTAAEKEKK